MAVNKISMAINYRKNKSTRLSSGGKDYAEVDRQKTLSTRGLAQHLKDHNCMVGRDAIMAVLIKLSECVPELVAQGVGVKLDGLDCHGTLTLPSSKSQAILLLLISVVEGHHLWSIQ